MQRLEVSGAVRPIYGSLGVKRLTSWNPLGHSRPVTGLLYLCVFIRLFFFFALYLLFSYYLTEC